MAITLRLSSRQAIPFFLSSFYLLIALALVMPIQADAACVQTQTYPPRTICTDEAGVVTDGGTASTGSGNTSTANSSAPQCVQLPTYPPQTVCTDGASSDSASLSPVAFWKFDEGDNANAIDSSGNSNHGVLENGATRFVGTVQGNKLLLDGVDDRMSVQTTSSNILNMNSFTVMAWIRPTEYGGIIMRKGNAGVARFNFGLRSDGVLYLRAGYSERTGSWQTTNPLPLNTWSHVAVTYTYGVGNKPMLYLNGVAQTLRSSVDDPAGNDPTNPSGVPVADTPHIFVGNNHNLTNAAQSGSDSAFEGRMDLVRVYNVALSAAAIMSAKSPEPENATYTPLPPVQQPDGTWIQPQTTQTTEQADSNSLISDLQAQVQALLAQLAALRGAAVAQSTPAATNACPLINRVLTRGVSGADVRELQAFLIARGHLAAGNDTGYFGALTEVAVQRFQNQAGVLSTGTPEGNGYGVFGPQTRSALRTICR